MTALVRRLDQWHACRHASREATGRRRVHLRRPRVRCRGARARPGPRAHHPAGARAAGARRHHRRGGGGAGRRGRVARRRRPVVVERRVDGTWGSPVSLVTDADGRASLDVRLARDADDNVLRVSYDGDAGHAGERQRSAAAPARDAQHPAPGERAGARGRRAPGGGEGALADPRRAGGVRPGRRSSAAIAAVTGASLPGCAPATQGWAVDHRPPACRHPLEGAGPPARLGDRRPQRRAPRRQRAARRPGAAARRRPAAADRPARPGPREGQGPARRRHPDPRPCLAPDDRTHLAPRLPGRPRRPASAADQLLGLPRLPPAR